MHPRSRPVRITLTTTLQPPTTIPSLRARNGLLSVLTKATSLGGNMAIKLIFAAILFYACTVARDYVAQSRYTELTFAPCGKMICALVLDNLTGEFAWAEIPRPPSENTAGPF